MSSDSKSSPNGTPPQTNNFLKSKLNSVRPNQLRKQLIARNEVVEVGARKAFYGDLDVAERNERVIKILINVLQIGLPSIFSMLSVIYFVIGSTFMNQK